MHGNRKCAKQRGAALVTGLVLLIALTLISLTGMHTTAMELAMAGNTQFAQNAFQAAETGIERAMAGAVLTTDPQVATHDLPGTQDTAQTSTTWISATPNLQGGTSLGVGFAAHHFEVVSVGASARAASSTHRQGFFIVGPDL